MLAGSEPGKGDLHTNETSKRSLDICNVSAEIMKVCSKPQETSELTSGGNIQEFAENWRDIHWTS